ncbi:heterocyst-inhibiting protein PatX [Planktothrix agardhii]
MDTLIRTTLMRIYSTILLSTLLVSAMTRQCLNPININLSSKSEVVAFLATETSTDIDTQGLPHRGSGR